jgi:hypothetical protein
MNWMTTFQNLAGSRCVKAGEQAGRRPGPNGGKVMKKLILAGVGLVALVVLPAVAAHAENGTPWIHVRVEEAKDQSKVSVNLPLSVIEVALEAAPEMIESHGKIHLGEHEKIKVQTMRKIWAELSAVGDTDLVTVESEEENVKVSREGDLVRILVDNKNGQESVRVEVPVSLVDAALAGQGDEINIKAAIAALKNQRGDIVTVTEPDTTVRIWIDEQNAQD